MVFSTESLAHRSAIRVRSSRYRRVPKQKISRGMALARSRWIGNRIALINTAADDGFSLLEVIVATTLLLVGVVSLAHLFVVSSKANRSAQATSKASLLAVQKMEQ